MFDFPIHIDTITTELPIVQFKGLFLLNNSGTTHSLGAMPDRSKANLIRSEYDHLAGSNIEVP